MKRKTSPQTRREHLTRDRAFLPRWQLRLLPRVPWAVATILAPSRRSLLSSVSRGTQVSAVGRRDASEDTGHSGPRGRGACPAQ